MNRTNFNIGVPPLTPAVKTLIIMNLAIWFGVQVILEGLILKSEMLTASLSLIPEKVLFEYSVWQLVTYMFLHTTQVTHVLLNMLTLWFFGSELESRWGTRFFWFYYLLCGVGAALIYVFGVALAAAFNMNKIALLIPVQGASGAVFGLLLAFGMLFGERVIYFFMVFPMKAKVFVAIIGFVQLASLITSREQGSEVAYLAHLGGLAAGFLLLKGHQIWQRRKWNQKLSSKNRGRSNLRLVVDNDKDKDGKDPKYWN